MFIELNSDKSLKLRRLWRSLEKILLEFLFGGGADVNAIQEDFRWSLGGSEGKEKDFDLGFSLIVSELWLGFSELLLIFSSLIWGISEVGLIFSSLVLGMSSLLLLIVSS